MRQSYTIYSQRKDYENAASLWEAVKLSNADFETEEMADQSVKLTASSGTLTISVKKHQKPGDEFSRLILGTHNFFRSIETTHSQTQKNLLDLILSCETAVGVVAEPEFKDDDERLDAVFAVAELFDGVIFNGDEMIDKNGKLILGADGSSETVF